MFKTFIHFLNVHKITADKLVNMKHDEVIRQFNNWRIFITQARLPHPRIEGIKEKVIVKWIGKIVEEAKTNFVPTE
jgi:hypothetical protein